jgi:hypothetical protein
MVIKAAENGRNYDAAPVLDGPIDRGILVERPMGSQLIIVSSIVLQNSAQMRFPQDNHMVDALTPDRLDQAFSKTILSRCAWGDGLVPDTHGAQSPRDDSDIDAIPISNEIVRSIIPRESL